MTTEPTVIPLSTYLRRAAGGTLTLATSMGLVLTLALIGMWQSGTWAPWYLIVLLLAGLVITTLASGLWQAARTGRRGARRQATLMSLAGSTLFLGSAYFTDKGLMAVPMLIAAVTLLWIFPTQDIEASPETPGDEGISPDTHAR